jgi:hypothetical protein
VIVDHAWRRSRRGRLGPGPGFIGDACVWLHVGSCKRTIQSWQGALDDWGGGEADPTACTYLREADVITRTEVLLLPSDEALIEDSLRRLHPRVCFLDQDAWESVDAPPVRMSIDECGDVAAIWNPETASEVRGIERANGRIDGPQVGPVIQWLRSRLRNSRLEAGSWAASVDPERHPDMAAFARDAWKILQKVTSNKLVSGGSFSRAVVIGPPVRSFRVGPAALSAARAGEIELASNQARLLPGPD